MLTSHIQQRSRWRWRRWKPISCCSSSRPSCRWWTPDRGIHTSLPFAIPSALVSQSTSLVLAVQPVSYITKRHFTSNITTPKSFSSSLLGGDKARPCVVPSRPFTADYIQFPSNPNNITFNVTLIRTLRGRLGKPKPPEALSPETVTYPEAVSYAEAISHPETAATYEYPSPREGYPVTSDTGRLPNPEPTASVPHQYEPHQLYDHAPVISPTPFSPPLSYNDPNSPPDILHPSQEEEDLPPLTTEQSQVLTLLEQKRNIFLTGPAGSGKSLIIRHIKRWLEQRRKPYSVTASTGVAAVSIGGETLHSWSGLGAGDKAIDEYIKMNDGLESAIKDKKHKNNKYRKLNMLNRMSRLSILEKRYERIKETRVLIIDEISMIPADVLSKLDILLRSINQLSTHKPFGGIQLICCGDFFQLPPVLVPEERTCLKCGVKNLSQKERYQYSLIQYLDDEPLTECELQYLDNVGVSHEDWAICDYPREGKYVCGHVWNPTARYCFQSKAWYRAQFQTVKLTTVHRQKNTTFVNILENVKRGRITSEMTIFLNRCREPLTETTSGIRPTHLYTTRAAVDDENRREYEKLEGEELISVARDGGRILGDESRLTLKEQICYNLTEEELEDYLFFKRVRAASVVYLKVGCQVMLLSNLEVRKGLVNGARGVVTGFKDYTLNDLLTASQNTSDAAKLRDYFVKTNQPIIRIPLVWFLDVGTKPIVPYVFEQSSLQPEGYTEELWRVQIPLSWAWATTIHKSQGQTINYCVVDMKRTFASGQGYVGLSRVKDHENLQIIAPVDPRHGDVNWQNVFWADPDVLLFHQYLDSQAAAAVALPMNLSKKQLKKLRKMEKKGGIQWDKLREKLCGGLSGEQ